MPSIYNFGSPDLVPSVVYDYQAGWDRHIAEVDATSRLTIFHQMTMHHIGASPITLLNGAFEQYSVLATGSVANGIEWGLQHKAREGWTWGGNYTYERLHEHGDLGILGYRDALPTHKVNANIGYAWPSWEADLAGRYVSATKGMIADGTQFSPIHHHRDDQGVDRPVAAPGLARERSFDRRAGRREPVALPQLDHPADGADLLSFGESHLLMV